MDNWIVAVQGYFANYTSFSRRELWDMLREHLPASVSDGSIAWRIYELKQKGIIINTARGRYTLVHKPFYHPRISEDMHTLSEEIGKDFPYLRTCLSDTAWINDLMIHQVFHTELVLEVEKDGALSLFNRLSTSRKDIFYAPTAEVRERYMQGVDKPLVVLPLVSQSPLTKEEGVVIPPLEKLLVDILAEDLVYGSQHEEAPHIFKEAQERYTLNESKLLRYAQRRNRLAQVQAFITSNSISA